MNARERMLETIAATPFTRVTLEYPFWAPRQTVNRKVTLPIEYQQCQETGRIDAFKLEWKPGMPDEPHVFWDSDVAKWIEAGDDSLLPLLRGRALRRRPQDWKDGALYRVAPAKRQAVRVTAVPYAVWGNRVPGEEMLVWMNRAPLAERAQVGNLIGT